MNAPSFGDPLDAVDREILEALRSALQAADPPPPDLDDQVKLALSIQALHAEVADLERPTDDLADANLDYELMLLVERSTELAGTRGATMAFTLTFAADGLDVMVRSGGAYEDTARLDGWIVPSVPATVRVTQVGDRGRSWETEIDERGRFELVQLPPGLYRLVVVPRQDGAKAFATPTFEI